MRWQELKGKVSERLAVQGLCFLGVAEPQQPEALSRYKKWLAEGQHAEMSYLERGILPREDPQLVHPDADLVLLVGFRYGSRETGKFSGARIAQYARLKDYHRFMRKKLDQFVGWLVALPELTDQQISCRPTVDSAPVLERAMAASGNSGFIGKNTCYIHHSYGSFLLLAEVFVSGLNLSLTNLKKEDLEESQNEKKISGCGTCRRCQVHCPTGALDEDYRLDARKCLAYWSIEHRGAVPLEYWPHFAKYAFGCDICQNVCPKNRGVSANVFLDEVRKYKKVGSSFDLEAVLRMDQKGYEEMFGGTPLTRAKFVGLKRNAIIASVALASSSEKIKTLQENWTTSLLKQWQQEDDSQSTLKQTLDAIPRFVAHFT